MEGWWRFPVSVLVFLCTLLSEGRRCFSKLGIALVFYAVFYAVLALMFSLCMGGLFLTLDDNKPAYILESSLIGVNPGVAFRPIPANGVFVKIYNNYTINYYVEEIIDFLAPYGNESWFTAKSGCSIEDNYGFPDSPCFFIKLNKIYGWKPELYDTSSLPTDMPSDLLEYISALPPLEHQQIWVSCWEENANNTKIEYPWGWGCRAVSILSSTRKAITVLCKELHSRNTVPGVGEEYPLQKSIKEPSGYTRIQLQVEDFDNEASDV